MAGFGTYLKKAFNARPLGMPLPPNWVFLAGAGLLGWFMSPGFWLIGAGLEATYLLWLSTNGRFRRLVDADGRPPAPPVDRRAVLWAQLDEDARAEQTALEERCNGIVTSSGGDGHALLAQQQSDQLAQLCWLHLRLLAAQRAVRTVVRTGTSERGELKRRLADLERRRTGAADDLAQSLDGQLGIVRSRLAQFDEAGTRLAYLDSEIERLRQQVDLLRDQSLLAAAGTDAGGLSSSIAALGESLTSTNSWLRDQRLGDAAWDEAPPLPGAAKRTTVEA